MKYDKILEAYRDSDEPAKMSLSGTTPTIASLLPNTAYNGANLTSLTVSAVQNSTAESLIIFTTGASFTASFPASLKWINGAFSFAGNKSYIIAVANNIAIAGEVTA